MDELLQKLQSVELWEDQALAQYLLELARHPEERRILLEGHCGIDNQAYWIESIV